MVCSFLMAIATPLHSNGAIAAGFRGDYSGNDFARASEISAASPAPMMARCEISAE
jgi:hypothetical protein